MSASVKGAFIHLNDFQGLVKQKKNVFFSCQLRL